MILVTGGAGYIGSHTVKMLRARGRKVLVLDDLSEGHRAALLGAELAEGSMLDRAFLGDLFSSRDIAAVFHFAARCYVGESVTDPGKYYRFNAIGTLNLLDAMAANGVDKFVLSSTCATYGEPESMPIVETMPQAPVNPYGASKLVCEWMLRDFHRAHGMQSVSLRYFNAAGADPEGELGEDHAPETHLIPLVIQAAMGQREKVTVFGDDYPTPDGTCIRDYVHVCDLAEAHILALEAMESSDSGVKAFNLGNSAGTSVLEVIRAVEEVSGEKVPYEIGDRRAGDPPRLVGSSELVSSELGWQPQLGDIHQIVETAWKWHRAHPRGYGGE
ncbi:MAG: UDP-glucose 4-epimerase GalE [Planctomycetota bacterium]|jgi:UDP-glucose-4-epimerase GalE